MIIYVCDTNTKAETAKQFLLNSGYVATNVSAEQVQSLTYDAITYDGGGNDNRAGVWIVIGRK